MELNGWLALEAVQAREKVAAKPGEAIEPVTLFELPDGYGRTRPPTEHESSGHPQYRRFQPLATKVNPNDPLCADRR